MRLATVKYLHILIQIGDPQRCQHRFVFLATDRPGHRTANIRLGEFEAVRTFLQPSTVLCPR